MRCLLAGVFGLLAVVGQAETLGNPQTHWFLIESPQVVTSDVLSWGDLLGPERTAVFMNGGDVVTFEQYSHLVGWDDWLAAVREDRVTDLSRQKKVSELVLCVASGAFAAVSARSNTPLAVSLSALSVWSLIHGLVAYPEADRPLVAPQRTWNDLIEASR